MAHVFRARDRLLECNVAIKVIRSETLDDDLQARLQQEIAVSARIVHPNLIPLHDHGKLANGQPFLALALGEGSLLDLRRRNPSWPLIQRLVDETLCALAHLHARGICHLDVKLSNILLHRGPDNRYHAWLADLGLARADERWENVDDALSGTLGYMALELLLRRFDEVSPRTDLFAIGVMLFRLVTNTAPFRGQSPYVHIDERYRPPESIQVREGLTIPEGLDEIILTLLRPDPGSRYDLAADLRAALVALPKLAVEDEVIEIDAGTPLNLGPITHPNVAEPTAKHFAFRTQKRGPQGLPLWNRPPSQPLPFRAPPELGRGAKARASLTLFALREVPLVGRDTERQRLWDLARRVAVTQRPAVAIVQGTAGSGKTRLVDSVVRSLEEGGYCQPMDVVFTKTGAASDGYVGTVRRVLRLPGIDPDLTSNRLERWIARDRQCTLEAARWQASLLQRWGAPKPGDAPVSNAVAREFLLDSLGRYAWRTLSVLVIHDAHWCTSQDDGAALATSIIQLGLPVLVLLTVRPDDILERPSSKAAFQSLRALGAETMDLTPLSPAAMADFVEECLPLEPQLARDLISQSEGNPLFTRQTILSWIRRGALTRNKDRRFELTDSSEGFTGSLLEVVGRRIDDALERTADRDAMIWALIVLGLVGDGAPWTLVREAAGPGLEELVGMGVIVRQDGLTLMEHPLLADALRNRARIATNARKGHLALAQAWHRIGHDAQAKVNEARHLIAAGEPDRAVQSLGPALQKMQASSNIDDLVAAAELLLEAAQSAKDPGEASVRARLALFEAKHYAGQGAAAVEGLSKLLEETRDQPVSVEIAARLVRSLGYNERLDQGLPVLESVADLVAKAEPDAQARYAMARVSCLKQLSRIRPAERELRAAMALNVSESVEAELLMQLGHIVEGHDYAQSCDHFRSVVERSALLGHLALQSRALSALANSVAWRGDWELGLDLATKAERIVLTIGFTSEVPRVRNARAEVLRYQGRVDEAEALYHEGRNWSLATSQREWLIVFDLNLAICALLRGDAAAMEAPLIRAAPHCKWEPWASLLKASSAARLLLQGAGPDVVDDIDFEHVLTEGIDGPMTVAILARLLYAQGAQARAERLEEDAWHALDDKGFAHSTLEPMLRKFDQALAERLSGRRSL
jgi:hypothetical protein